MKQKNQHYVPQFHLKQWSLDGKLISLYNKRNKRYVDNKAAIKHQASENYLYDNDGTVESLLNKIETSIAPIYKKIMESESTNDLSEDEWEFLYLHTVLCNERTIAAGNDQEELSMELLQAKLAIYQAHGRYMDVDASEIKKWVRLEHPCNTLIRGALKYYPLITDLRVSLLKNTSQIDFLTSDYPAIKYNLWSNQRKLYSGWGLSSVGLMYILPISPRFALIVYDPVIYSIKNLKGDVVSIENDSQINDINRLMLINANENIYFSRNISIHYIDQMLAGISDYITPRKAVTKFSNAGSCLVIHEPRRIFYTANLSFLSIHPDALKIPVPNNMKGLSRPTSEEIGKYIK